MSWGPIILTIQLALITTFILLLISIPLASWLSHTKSRIKPVIETIVSLPLVLPPTVIGFYLLIAFSPANSLGSWLNVHIGLSFVFSFEGLVLASVLYSLPFMVQPVQSGLKNLNPILTEASFSLGKSRSTTLLKVQLPNIKASLLTGIVLAFTHTVGEFGVVLMIGGSIPGETKVASIAIYEEVEALNYSSAHAYSLFLLTMTFVVLLAVYMYTGGFIKSQRS